MYLPVILINRFGWPGFIAFAIPNVLGCAAFGYVVRNRSRSQAMVARHGTAMMWFSIITIAYHMFFIVWLFTDLLPVAEIWIWVPVTIAAIVLALGIVLSFLPDRDWLVLAAAVYAISLAAFFVVGFSALRHIHWTGSEQRADLYWLTPVLCFGFLLCPYLDLTFHRAIQRSPSCHAFGVFGLAFFVMILLTCMLWFRGSRILPAIGVAHILAQSVFTVGAHLREVRLMRVVSGYDLRIAWIILPLLAASALVLARFFTDYPAAGEGIYLGFLSLYGTLLPGCVAIWGLSSRRDRLRSVDAT